MDEIRNMGLVFILTALFWVLGFWGQRIENALQSPGIKAQGRGVWLLGIRPRKGEKVYLGPALLQIWALLYLVAGFLAVWFGGTKVFRILTAVYIFGFPFFGLFVHFILHKRKQR